MLEEKKQEPFESIIGYENMKVNLKRILDVLNDIDKYKEIGSTMPHGLLLFGPPGLGKTTIAKEFIKFSNRKAYIIRKNKSDGKFIDYISKIFETAKNNQPSLILLDDLDKFAEADNNRVNNEEFVTVQSLMDENKENNIFIIATANNENLLPRSLLRSGRFDIQIRIDKPEEDDSFKIIEYYLNNKKISKDVNIKNISFILNGSSCADLEKVCNQAGIYAGYKNKTTIGMEELIRASLEWSFHTNIEDLNENYKYALNIAYHEAGHALIGTLLEPGSVSFITITKNDSDTRGITKYHNNDYYWDDIDFMENRLKTLLAGKAATEIVYGKCDTGTNSDLHRAYDLARRFVDNYCMYDFNSWITHADENSEKVKSSKDKHTNKLISKYYEEVKDMLIKNRKALDALAYNLKEKKVLFQEDIEKIIKDPSEYFQIKKFEG